MQVDNQALGDQRTFLVDTTPCQPRVACPFGDLLPLGLRAVGRQVHG